MTAITSEIWQVGGEGFTGAQDAAIYLICFDGNAAIVDAGCGGHIDRLEANVHACGIKTEQVEYLLITHCHFDHIGGAEEVRTRFDCPIVVHEKDAVAMETGNSLLTAANWYGKTQPSMSVDIKLSGSLDHIALGSRRVTAIHTPGHTPGSVVYLVESDGMRVLFGQDVHGPLHDDFGSDRHAYQKSLLKMAELGADILCEGHFGVFRGADKVKAFIQSFL